MLESLGKSVSTIVDERLSSPLVSSFVVAWSLYNYKFFVILLSAASVSDTFRLIHEVVFPNLLIVGRDGILLPLIFTAIYIFLMPIPSKFVYEKWKKTQKEINEIKQRVDGDSLLTLDESRAMRAKERELFARLDEATNEINRFKDDLRVADRSAKDVTASKDAHNEELEKLTQRALRAEGDSASLRVQLETLQNSDQGGDLLGHRAMSMPTPLTDQEIQLLIFIGNNPTLDLDEVSIRGPMNNIATQYYLEELIRKDLVTIRQLSEHDERRSVELTHLGRKYLVENHLVKLN